MTTDPSAFRHAPSATQNDHLDRFTHPTYLIRRKVFKLFGGAFHVYDDQGNVVLYSKMKAFKLREDIRLYTGEDMQTELLHITTRSILDISGAYDVHDSITGEHVGTLKRAGIRSAFLRDHWDIHDSSGAPIGSIEEDSMLKALLRRFVDAAAFLLPQQYHFEMDGQTVCTCRQNFNPFVQKLTVDFTPDTEVRLDRRLGLAAAVLLLAIEGRQES